MVSLIFAFLQYELLILIYLKYMIIEKSFQVLSLVNNIFVIGIL